jgi:acyl carrier protein
MEEKIQEWIINWFRNNTNIIIEEITSNIDKNYFLEKWIDSLKFILLITAIEDEYKIRFSNEEFQDRKFASIIGLTEIVREKLNE